MITINIWWFIVLILLYNYIYFKIISSIFKSGLTKIIRDTDTQEILKFVNILKGSE